MDSGLSSRLDKLFNRHSDGRAVCVAADHGYMSDVTPNVVNLRSIVGSVIRGGVDGILLSPGQAIRLEPLFRRRDGPALIVRADWMNMPRLGGANITNAVPQRHLFHQKVLTAEQALKLGATAITIYLFLGYNDRVEVDRDRVLRPVLQRVPQGRAALHHGAAGGRRSRDRNQYC